jgi:putative transposase
VKWGVGHVLQGRDKAILVERETYLLELIRYVVLNPVRARMVEVPDQWPWSSYRATIGQEPAPPWLAGDWVLRQFAHRREEAQVQYAQFVHDGQRQPSIWRGLQNQMYLGGEDFIAHMQTRLQATESLDEIPKVQRQPVPQSLHAYAEAYDDKRLAMVAAYASGAYTLKAIAAYFGVHYSTVSREVRRVEGPAGITSMHDCKI